MIRIAGLRPLDSLVGLERCFDVLPSEQAHALRCDHETLGSSHSGYLKRDGLAAEGVVSALCPELQDKAIPCGSKICTKRIKDREPWPHHSVAAELRRVRESHRSWNSKVPPFLTFPSQNEVQIGLN